MDRTCRTSCKTLGFFINNNKRSHTRRSTGNARLLRSSRQFVLRASHVVQNAWLLAGGARAGVFLRSRFARIRPLLYDVAIAPLCAHSRGTSTRDQRGATRQGVRGVTRQDRHRLDEARAGASSPSLLAACAGGAGCTPCALSGTWGCSVRPPRCVG